MTTATAAIYDEIQRLREAPDADATKRLVQIMQEDRMAPVRAEAAKAIAAIHSLEGSRPLAKLLSSPNVQARRLAAEALGELDTPSSLEALVGALGDDDEVVRANAAASLGKIADPGALGALQAALFDKSFEVQFAAAGAIADLGKAESVEPLLAWSDRIYSAGIKEFNAHQKATMIHAIWVNLLEQLHNEEVYLLSSHIGQRVDIKTWGILHTGARDTHCWLQESIDSPVGRAVKEELQLRKAETKEDAGEAPEIVEGPPTIELSMDDMERHEAEMNGSKTAPSGGGQTIDDILASLGPVAPEAAPAQQFSGLLDISQPAAATSGASMIDDILGMGGLTPAQAAEPTEPEPLAAAISDRMEPETDAEPVAAAEAEPEPEAAPEPSKPAPRLEPEPSPLPHPTGLVADFLGLLEGQSLDSLALIGGCVRDLALGKEPTDLDVAVELKIWEEMLERAGDPVAWNEQFAAAANPLVERLADALGATVEDLLEGRAVFASGDGRAHVHYVGPFISETVETTYAASHVGRVRRQRASRLGIVIDQGSKRVYGLAPISTIDALCMDCLGRAIGDPNPGLRHLADRVIHAEEAPRRLGVNDILRLLSSQHALEAELSEPTVAMLESAANAVRENPEAAHAELSRPALDQLVAVGGLDNLMERLDLLGLSGAALPWMDPERRAEGESLLARREREREERLAGVRAAAESADAELLGAGEQYEARNARFAELAGEIEQAKTATAELAALRREQATRLAAADEAADEAARAADEATARLREQTSSGRPDVTLIRAQRDLLNAKHVAETQAAACRSEIEAAREQLSKAQAEVRRLENELDAASRELESAITLQEEAQARADESRAALEAALAESELTPTRRRERLRARPKPVIL